MEMETGPKQNKKREKKQEKKQEIKTRNKTSQERKGNKRVQARSRQAQFFLPHKQ
jgi:hypothetical protein